MKYLNQAINKAQVLPCKRNHSMIHQSKFVYICLLFRKFNDLIFEFSFAMRLIPVNNKRTKREFLDVARIIYRDDQNWICPPG